METTIVNVTLDLRWTAMANHVEVRSHKKGIEDKIKKGFKGLEEKTKRVLRWCEAVT